MLTIVHLIGASAIIIGLLLTGFGAVLGACGIVDPETVPLLQSVCAGFPQQEADWVTSGILLLSSTAVGGGLAVFGLLLLLPEFLPVRD